MHNHDTPAAKRNQHDQIECVQRLELLLWRFNEAEIQRLSQLQLIHRRQPQPLDLPFDACRLQFARWLVEHNRLSEDMGAGLEGQPCAEQALDLVGRKEHAHPPSLSPMSLIGLSSHDHADELAVEHAQWSEPDQWHRVLLSAWSAVRRGMAKVAAFGRELGRCADDILGDGDPWGEMYRARDSYGPRGPDGAARSLTDDPWVWRFFWLGGFGGHM